MRVPTTHVNSKYYRGIPKLREDRELFKETFRVTSERFDELFNLLDAKEEYTAKGQDNGGGEETHYIGVPVFT